MRLPLLAALLSIFLASTPTWASGPDLPTSSFTVADKAEIPGTTLTKGTYSIRVLDHLSDRMIVKVSKGTATKATFIGLPGQSLPATSSTGPITWGSAGKHKVALRGFSFSDGTVVEFVYPKAQAAALAKENSTKVAAIDPASEGRVQDKLSNSDMQLVTLWLLSPTTVGPDNTPGIAAEKYKAPVQQVAGHSTPASTTMAKSQTNLAGLHADADKGNVRPKRALTALPHTAGPMPLIWLLGVFSLGGALASHFMRRMRPARG